MLNARKTELTEIINQLARQRDTLIEQLNDATLSDEDIARIAAFAEEVRKELVSLNIHELEFATKRQLVETLNIRGTLMQEDGIKVLYLHWCLQDFRIPLDGEDAGGTNQDGSINEQRHMPRRRARRSSAPE